MQLWFFVIIKLQCLLLWGAVAKNFTFSNSILLVFFFNIDPTIEMSSFLKIVNVPTSPLASSIIWLIERCFDFRYLSGLVFIFASYFCSIKLLLVFAIARFKLLIGGRKGFFFLYRLFYLMALNFANLRILSFYWEIGVRDEPCEVKCFCEKNSTFSLPSSIVSSNLSNYS